MAGKPPEIVQYYREIFENLGPIESKRFFGGWDFRHMNVQFAVYILNDLYLVVDDALRAKLKEMGSQPFSHEKKGKEVSVQRWYSVPDELLENPDELLPYAEQAFHVAPRK